MGRFILFLIVVAAALAGVWFYMPGGKDMLTGAKDKAMSYMPGKADDAGDAAVEEAVEVVDETVEATEEVVEEVVETTEDAAAEEPQG